MSCQQCLVVCIVNIFIKVVHDIYTKNNVCGIDSRSKNADHVKKRMNETGDNY